MVYFLLLLFVLFIDKSNSSNIVSHYLKCMGVSCDLFVNIKDTRLKIEFELDMTIDFTWVHLLLFDIPEIINVNETNTFILEGQQCLFDTYLFNISLTDTINLDNFIVFHRVNSAMEGFDSFPLGYTIRNESFSVIHTLYNNHLIDHKKFCIFFNTTESSQIFFGGLPDNIKENYQYNKSCEVVEGYPSWGCQMKKIIIGDYTYENNHYQYFQANDYLIYAPLDFMLYLSNTVFKEHLQNNTCKFYKDVKIKAFQCNCEIKKYFKDISFIFNDIMLTFNSNELFGEYVDVCELKIKQNYINDTQWIFGHMVLSKYPTIFDYEESSITFYSNSDLSIHYNSSHSKQIIVQITHLILVIGCFFLIYVKFIKFDLQTKENESFYIKYFGL